MRITERIAFETAMQGQGRSVSQLADATRMASTGLRVSRPSDDPVAWSMKAGHEARLQRMQNRQRTVSRSGSELDVAETALAGAAEVFDAARALAVQAANGTVDPQSRAAMATQVTAMRQQVIAYANTRGATGFLFGGTASGTAPFNTVTGAFVGNDTPVNVDVADNAPARANASGATAFTVTGGRDVITDLQNLATALAANNVPGIQAAITALDAAHQQIVTAEVTTGVAAERFHSAGEVTGAALLAVQTARASEVEADAPTAYSTLSRAQAGYQQAIAVTREILQTTSVSRG